MMSKQTKIHVPIGILYRWMYPAVNPYSCGDRSVFTCVPMGRLASICDTTDRTRQKYCRSRQEDPVIKSHGQRLDLAPCRSHQWASSCLVRIIHDGSSSPSLTLPHSMGEGEGGGPFLVKRISLFARDSRDLREKRDGSEVSSSLVAPVAHVLPVSLTIHAQAQRIRDCSRSVHE